MDCSESEVLLQIEFWIQLQNFERKIENETHLRERSLVDQEWHFALEMSTSEMAHVGRERERTQLQNNNKTKPKQLKLNKTNLSMWS
jgi:hypothetical protein